MNKPTVSVVLPYFNAEKTLERAIQSILDQSLKDFELLLVDNNSSDKSASIASRFVEKDNRIVLLSEKQQGVVFAANVGFTASKGKYLARMDADDWSFPNRLEAQSRMLDQQKHIGLVSGQIEYGGSSSNEGFVRYVRWLNEINEPEEIRLNQFVEYPLVHPSTMMRRELFAAYGLFNNGHFPEDYEYFLRLQQGGVEMGKVEEVVLEWNDLDQRLTKADSRYSPDAFFKIKAKYLSKWLERFNPNHPEVVIWGAGKLSRRRSTYLKQYGIKIQCYIDIIEIDREEVVHYQQVERYVGRFVLSYVGSWDARSKIRKHLNTHGFKEGMNYLVCA